MWPIMPPSKKPAPRYLQIFGKVDILINNAGVTRDGLSMRMSVTDWETVINTNLTGAFNFVQSVQRAMIKQRSGRIINISSVIGLIGNAGLNELCRKQSRPARSLPSRLSARAGQAVASRSMPWRLDLS